MSHEFGKHSQELIKHYLKEIEKLENQGGLPYMLQVLLPPNYHKPKNQPSQKLTSQQQEEICNAIQERKLKVGNMYELQIFPRPPFVDKNSEALVIPLILFDGKIVIVFNWSYGAKEYVVFAPAQNENGERVFLCIKPGTLANEKGINNEELKLLLDQGIVLLPNSESIKERTYIRSFYLELQKKPGHNKPSKEINIEELTMQTMEDLGFFEQTPQNFFQILRLATFLQLSAEEFYQSYLNRIRHLKKLTNEEKKNLLENIYSNADPIFVEILQKLTYIFATHPQLTNGNSSRMVPWDTIVFFDEFFKFTPKEGNEIERYYDYEELQFHPPAHQQQTRRIPKEEDPIKKQEIINDIIEYYQKVPKSALDLLIVQLNQMPIKELLNYFYHLTREPREQKYSNSLRELQPIMPLPTLPPTSEEPSTGTTIIDRNRNKRTEEFLIKKLRMCIEEGMKFACSLEEILSLSFNNKLEDPENLERLKILSSFLAMNDEEKAELLERHFRQIDENEENRNSNFFLKFAIRLCEIRQKTEDYSNAISDYNSDYNKGRLRKRDKKAILQELQNAILKFGYLATTTDQNIQVLKETTLYISSLFKNLTNTNDQEMNERGTHTNRRKKRTAYFSKQEIANLASIILSLIIALGGIGYIHKHTSGYQIKIEETNSTNPIDSSDAILGNLIRGIILGPREMSQECQENKQELTFQEISNAIPSALAKRTTELKIAKILGNEYGQIKDFEFKPEMKYFVIGYGSENNLEKPIILTSFSDTNEKIQRTPGMALFKVYLTPEEIETIINFIPEICDNPKFNNLLESNIQSVTALVITLEVSGKGNTINIMGNDLQIPGLNLQNNRERIERADFLIIGIPQT